MANTGAAGAVTPAAWHEPVRGHFQAAWDALDLAQIALCRQCEDTRDERVRRFKERFDAAASALIILAVDELYAPYAGDANGAQGDSVRLRLRGRVGAGVPALVGLLGLVLAAEP